MESLGLLNFNLDLKKFQVIHPRYTFGKTYLKGQKQKKDQEKGQTMEDISRMVTELNSKIEAKREIIEPLLNRVRYIYDYIY